MTLHAFRKAAVLAAAGALATSALLTNGSPAHAGYLDLGGYWPMEEGRGQTTYDHSIHGNHGRLGSTSTTDANDPAWIRLPSFLLPHSALRFGGDDYVQVADAPSLEPDGVTVTVRLRSTAAGYFRYVVAKGALACENASYGLYTGANGGLRFYVSDGTTHALSADAGIGIWDGQWHTVVGDFDGTSVTLTVDDQPVGDPTPADLDIAYGLPDSDDLYLGDYAGPCGAETGFSGDVDSAAVARSSEGGLLGGILGALLD